MEKSRSFSEQNYAVSSLPCGFSFTFLLYGTMVQSVPLAERRMDVKEDSLAAQRSSGGGGMRIIEKLIEYGGRR